MSAEKLIESTKNNIKTDRDRLTSLYDKLESISKGDNNDENPFGLAMVSEQLVKITDSLTKQNGQLVDLAKLKHKIEFDKTSGNNKKGDTDRLDVDYLFDEIEQSAK